MKIRSATIGMSYTYQPAKFHSAKGEASITFDLEEGDDLELLTPLVRAMVEENMVANLANVEEVHTKIFTKGYTPKDLHDDNNPSEMLPDDDEDEWGV